MKDARVRTGMYRYNYYKDVRCSVRREFATLGFGETGNTADTFQYGEGEPERIDQKTRRR